MAASSEGALLAAGGFGRMLRVWEGSAGRQLCALWVDALLCGLAWLDDSTIVILAGDGPAVIDVVTNRPGGQ